MDQLTSNVITYAVAMTLFCAYGLYVAYSNKADKRIAK